MPVPLSVQPAGVAVHALLETGSEACPRLNDIVKITSIMVQKSFTMGKVLLIMSTIKI